MSAPFSYFIIYDETTHDVGKFTREIYTALNEVESYNVTIQAAKQIREHSDKLSSFLADQDDTTEKEFVDDVEGWDLEISRLESEKQIIFDSIDLAILFLAAQREVVNHMGSKLEDDDDDFQRPVANALEQWDTDLASLKQRRQELLDW